MTNGKSAFLFIDDTYIENLDSVAKGVVPAEKVSQRPLIEKDQAWEDEWHIGSYINVMYDDEENIFKMWYGLWAKDTLDHEAVMAYATSTDGFYSA